MLVSPERIATLLREHGLWPPPDGETNFLAALRAANWRFEVFARALGAKNASAMDVSNYERHHPSRLEPAVAARTRGAFLMW
jgi:hypothetical protein